MSRKVFDKLTSAGGIVAVVVLLVAGGLLTWGHSFVNSNVHSQLAQQQIFFPPAAAFAHPKAATEITPSMIPSVSQYAGQQLLTGAQAKVYADHFIAVHLSRCRTAGVYSKISAAALANPNEQHRSPGRCRPPSAAPRCAGSCSRPTRSQDRPDHAVGRDRLIRPGRGDGAAGRAGLRARSPHRAGGADVPRLDGRSHLLTEVRPARA